MTVHRDNPTTWRDTGTLLGHLSPRYAETRSTNGEGIVGITVDSPIQIEDTRPPEDNSKGAPAAYDPFARELTLGADLAEYFDSGSEREQVHGESIVEVHEDKHRELGDKYLHLYGFDRIRSFDLVLKLLRGESPSSNRVQRRLADFWRTTTMSEVTQEVHALTHQAAYLSEELGPEEAHRLWNELLDPIDLQPGDGPLDPAISDETKLAPHTPAAWFVQHGLTPWDIPVRDVAFRLRDFSHQTEHRLSGDDEPLNLHHEQDPAPDAILWTAATTDRERVEQCSQEAQWSLLIDRLNTSDHFSIDRVIGSAPQWEELSDASDLGHDPSPEAVYHQFRRVIEKKQKVNDDLLTLPLWADSYPGKPDRQKTLAAVLDALYETRPMTPKRGVDRCLFVTRDVWDWAENTRLLEMAVELWTARDELLVPLLRQVMCETSATKQSIRDWFSTLEVGASFDSYPHHTSSDNIEKAITRKAAELEASGIGDEREAYSDLITDLCQLGRAIRDGDSDSVARFY